MTMHLAHPALSMTGKRKGKLKFRNAEQARKHKELETSWLELKKKHGVEEQDRKKTRALKAAPLVYNLAPPPGREPQKVIPSRDSGIGVAAKKTAPVYTGTKIKGIGTMHKSNAVPIFSDEEAEAIAHMRR